MLALIIMNLQKSKDGGDAVTVARIYLAVNKLSGLRGYRLAPGSVRSLPKRNMPCKGDATPQSLSSVNTEKSYEKMQTLLFLERIRRQVEARLPVLGNSEKHEGRGVSLLC